jgi:hypothetical protein
MPSNLFRRLRAPAFVHYMGVTFYTADAIAWDPQLEAFGVPSDAFGDIDQRLAGRVIKLAFMPMSCWTAAALAVLFPFANYRKGQFNTPVYTVSAVAIGSTNKLTLNANANAVLTGTGVRFNSTGTLPTPLAAGVTYYAVANVDGTICVADTEVHALAGTNIIAITAAGTGVLKMIQNSPLTINFLDGDNTQLTLWNFGQTKMPALDLQNKKQPIGQIEGEGYALAGTAWSDNNSVFTLGTWTGEEPELDETQIPTVAYQAAWGATVPFTDLEPRDGVQIDFTMKLGEVPTSADGILCRQIQDVTAMAKLRPTNLAPGDLLGEIPLQGEGAAIGASLPAQQLVVSGPGANPYIALNGAALMNEPMKIGSMEDIIEVLNFKTKRTWVGGVLQPVFTVGVAAP